MSRIVSRVELFSIHMNNMLIYVISCVRLSIQLPIYPSFFFIIALLKKWLKMEPLFKLWVDWILHWWDEMLSCPLAFCECSVAVLVYPVLGMHPLLFNLHESASLFVVIGLDICSCFSLISFSSPFLYFFLFFVIFFYCLVLLCCLLLHLFLLLHAVTVSTVLLLLLWLLFICFWWGGGGGSVSFSFLSFVVRGFFVVFFTPLYM